MLESKHGWAKCELEVLLRIKDSGTVLINFGCLSLRVVHNIALNKAWMLVDGKCLHFSLVCTTYLKTLLPEKETLYPYLAAF